MKTPSEKRNFFTTFVVPAILVLTAVTSMLFFQNRTASQAKQWAYRVLDASAQEQTATLKEIFEGRFAILETFANSLASQGGLLTLENITTRMNAIAESSDFEDLAIAGADGIAYTDDGQRDDSSDRFYMTEALAGRRAVQKLTDSRLYEKSRLIFSVPLRVDGRVVGAVLGSFSDANLRQLLISTAFSGSAYSFLCDNAGTIIVDAESASLLYEEGNLLDTLAGEDVTFLDDTTLQTIEDDLQNGRKGVAAYDIGGEKRYAVYQPAGFNDWFIFNVVPSAVVDESATAQNRFGIISIGVVTFCAVLLLVIMALREKHRVEELRQLQERQLVLLRTDAVTGFLNEAGFIHAAQELLGVLPDEKFCAMLDISILNFNQFNVSFGSPAGDGVLRDASRVLLGNCRAEQPCARLSGDRFACLSVDCADVQDLLRQIDVLQNKLQMAESSRRLQMNFGVYVITDKTMPVEEIIVCAVAARLSMHEGQLVDVYDQSIHRRMIEDARLIEDMDEGLRQEQFVPYFQPKYDAQTRRIVGAEALVRWIRPDGTMTPPDRFIGLFEQNRLITKLDRYMFEHICRKLAAMDAPVPISVNFSRAHLYNADFPDMLAAIAKKYHISTGLLEIELTETAFFDQPDELIAAMNRLREMGFLVSIDDFGSGFSSLNLLKNVRFDVVKLDKEFFSDTLENERGQAVVKTVLALADALQMHTVAEGVETSEQFEFLRENGCDMIQGYYFSPPVPEAAFDRLLQSQEKALHTPS